MTKESAARLGERRLRGRGAALAGYAPHAHAFRYRIAQLYLDLDELDRVFAGRWLWSTNRRNLAEFRRNDYLGPTELPLAEAVGGASSGTPGGGRRVRSAC